MGITWRFATAADAAVLAEWNYRLIRDEGHRNQMALAELTARIRDWLDTNYRAVLFVDGESLGYALYRIDPDLVYLRQFYITPENRRRGFGRQAICILREEIWPRSVRLTVDVLCHNHAGISFWRAVGYRDYALTLEILPEAKPA